MVVADDLTIVGTVVEIHESSAVLRPPLLLIDESACESRAELKVIRTAAPAAICR